MSRHRIEAIASLVSRAETQIFAHAPLRRARLAHVRFDRKRGEA